MSSSPPAVPLQVGGMLREHATDLNRLLRLIDPFVVSGLFWVVVCGELNAVAKTSNGIPTLIVVALCTALILPTGKLYLSYRQSSLITLCRRITTSWLLVLGALLALVFLTKMSAYFSRGQVITWALLSWVELIALHAGSRKLIRWHRIRGGNSRSIVYWGRTDAAIAFYNRLQANPHLGLRLQAWFSSAPVTASEPLPLGMPVCGGMIPDLRRWLDSNRADQIVFSYVSKHDLPMKELIQFLGDTCIPVAYAPSWSIPGMNFHAHHIGGQPCIDLWKPTDSALDRQLKRCFDLGVATAALVLLSPLLLVAALAVKLSSQGPVLFAQDRYGLDGRRFRIYKFRTMAVLEPGDQPGLRQASRHDPRITAVGAFLRRWSLDELPQLFNVIRGSMSLVGPRPHAVAHNEAYRMKIPGYMQRHLVKPGITGLAQVNGYRGETSSLDAMTSRVSADLDYQREWSLAGDLKILLLTVLRLRSPHAY